MLNHFIAEGELDMKPSFSRRALLTAAAAISQSSSAAMAKFHLAPKPQDVRGFNLNNLYKSTDIKQVNQDHFTLMREFGFNTIRIPIDYRAIYSEHPEPNFIERGIAILDEIIDNSIRHSMNVIISFHRAPGYCVNPPQEPDSIWTSTTTQKILLRLTSMILSRYQSISSIFIGINPINEPDRNVSDSDYSAVINKVIDHIDVDHPYTPVFIDGSHWANRFPIGIRERGNLVFCCRGYQPMQFTHHKAEWKNYNELKTVSWPYKHGQTVFDIDYLKSKLLEGWESALKSEIPLIAGEWGVYRHTPHAATLAFMKDQLQVFRSFSIGWLLWELEGPFGVVGSCRKDVIYKDYRSLKIDERMLNLLTS